MPRIRLVGFVLTALFALPATASPIIIHVTSLADSGPGTLRQAIIDGNALPANDFPKIYIDLGGYTEAIQPESSLPLITKMIEIHGTQSLPAAINGRGLYSLLHVNSATTASIVRLSNLTLRRGVAENGGCLRIDDTDGIYIIDGVLFNGCSAGNLATGLPAFGGAIYARGGAMTITDSQFFGNKATGMRGYGGAIYFYGGAATVLNKLSISDSIFSNNAASTNDPGTGQSYGGAIAATDTQLVIEDSLFHDNRATETSDTFDSNHGGAIYSNTSMIGVYRSTFTLNKASHGGALYASTGQDSNEHKGLTLINNTFVGNVASLGVGAVRAYNLDTVLRNNSFFANDGGFSWVGNNFGAAEDTSDAVTVYHQMWNNLFTNSFAGPSCAIDSESNQSSGRNIIADDSCELNFGTNMLTTDVVLEGYLLGSTLPAAPLRFFADSPALDAGTLTIPDDNDIPACPELDGQGNPRVFDGDLSGDARCDIGAFEWQREASLFANDFENRLEPAQVGP